MSENTEPRRQGMSRNLPVVTQSMWKRLTMRSLRLVQRPTTIQLPRMVRLTIQKSLGNWSRQLALNYYYSYYYGWFSLVRDLLSYSSSFFLFSLFMTMRDITRAATMARKSTAEAMYQGREMDWVASKMMGVSMTLMESAMKGMHRLNPISISKCSAAQRAMTKPCMVKADDPAMPTMARRTQTMQRQPVGRRSKRTAVRSSAVKLVRAMMTTVI